MTTTPAGCPLAALLATHQAAVAAPPSAPARALEGVEPPRLLWTMEKAAERISIGKTKLYGLLRNDQVPSVMLGGRRYVAEQDLVELVERLRAGWEPWE